MSKLTKIAIGAVCAAGICFTAFAVTSGGRSPAALKADANATAKGRTQSASSSPAKKQGISVQLPGLSVNVGDDRVSVNMPFLNVNVDGDDVDLDGLENLNIGDWFEHGDYDDAFDDILNYDDADQYSKPLLLSKKFELGAFTSVTASTVSSDIIIKRTEKPECSLEVFLVSGSASLEDLGFSSEIHNKALQIKAYNPKYNGSIKNKPQIIIVLSIPNSASLASVQAETVNGDLVCRLVPSKEMTLTSTNGDIVIIAADCAYSLKSTNGTLVANSYTAEDGGSLDGTIGSKKGSITASTVNGDIVLKKD